MDKWTSKLDDLILQQTREFEFQSGGGYVKEGEKDTAGMLMVNEKKKAKGGGRNRSYKKPEVVRNG